MMTLNCNQENAIKKLSNYKVGALFMQAGSGKTLTAVNIINSRNDIKKVLWFTPYRTKENLDIELQKCNLKFQYEIVGIESLSNSSRLYLKLLDKYKDIEFFCVVDESLKIKNDTIRFHRINEIGKLAKYKLILNGTPISKNYLDLYNQMTFLSPKILKMNYNEFYNTFVVEKQLLKSNQIKRKWVDSFDNLEYLFSLISPFIYESDLQLDININRTTINYRIDSSELNNYFKIKKQLLRNLEEFKSILPTIQQLQHSYSITNSKINALKTLLKNLKEHNIQENEIIIFYKYVNEYDFLVNNIKGDYKILSLQKHAFGLNLQKQNVIIFFNISFDYAVIEQAERRILRLGQQKDCVIYYFKSNVGLDNMIFSNLEKKASLLNELKQKTINELERKL